MNMSYFKLKKKKITHIWFSTSTLRAISTSTAIEIQLLLKPKPKRLNVTSTKEEGIAEQASAKNEGLKA